MVMDSPSREPSATIRQVLCDFVRQRLAQSRVKLRADARIAVDMLTRTAGAERIESICRSVLHCSARLHA